MGERPKQVQRRGSGAGERSIGDPSAVPRQQAAPLIVLVAVSVALGIFTEGAIQVVAVIAAIVIFIAWHARVTRRDRAGPMRLPKSARLWLPLVVTATGLLTLPLLGYASLGIVNATFAASMDLLNRRSPPMPL